MSVEGIREGGGLEAWRALKRLAVHRLQEVALDPVGPATGPAPVGAPRGVARDSISVKTKSEALHAFSNTADELEELLKRLNEFIEGLGGEPEERQ